MANPLIAKLSESQKICLLFAAAGKTSKEIAAHTSWTHKTIDQYMNQGAKLLQFKNRREAGRFLLLHLDQSELKEFQLKFLALANFPNSEPSPVGSEKRAGLSGPLKRLCSRLRLPPLGGRQNDLDWQDKLIQMGFVAIILAISGLFVMLLLAGALKLLV
jgi:DNA-binding CsgD family transcriptional regulator